VSIELLLLLILFAGSVSAIVVVCVYDWLDERESQRRYEVAARMAVESALLREHNRAMDSVARIRRSARLAHERMNGLERERCEARWSEPTMVDGEVLNVEGKAGEARW
jgi:hypothetical protein